MDKFLIAASSVLLQGNAHLDGQWPGCSVWFERGILVKGVVNSPSACDALVCQLT